MRGNRLLLVAPLVTMLAAMLVAMLATPLVLPAAAALADELELPTPDAAQLAATALLQQLPNFRPDRLLPSTVPGPVVNDELVDVGVGPDGTVLRVLLDQRLRITGTGDYAVRERGPARSATSLTDERAPITQRGAVVWQGFSPGSRELAARLVLDPSIEADHLPLRLAVSFVGKDGVARALEPGGRVPGPGTVTLRVSNATQQPQELVTASDIAASAVAGPLDAALAVARRPSAARLPNADVGLPRKVQVIGAARIASSQSVPLRLTGTLRVSDGAGQVTGPATTPLPDGASFAGVLGGSTDVTFTATVDKAATLTLDLTAVTALDPRNVTPPGGHPTWKSWAAASPPQVERKAALDLLVEVAATGARASSYSPYLGADLLGSGSTSFHFAFAPAEQALAAITVLEPQTGAIVLASLALLLICVNAGLLWRLF